MKSWSGYEGSFARWQKKYVDCELRTPLQQGKPLLENYSKEMTKEKKSKKKEKES